MTLIAAGGIGRFYEIAAMAPIGVIPHSESRWRELIRLEKLE